MLTQEVIKLLSEQINKELYAANLYLSMSSWCYENSYDGAGLFLFDHAQEESEHARKLITYLNETDSHVEIGQVEKPEQSFKSLLDVFEKTYAHEQFITKSINTLVEHMLANKDYSTFNFLQWYVSEQHEEEALFRGIVDKIKLIGDQSHGVYLADQYIKDIALSKK
ncbi:MULTISPECIES: ferritin [unclassified Campylobacter]|uniref:ferritin n=1 Tax=unclassified Campylobacter TaxID=2593542 RepID=UPI001237C2E4|nr:MULTISPECIES: ferritin [unclassified Campylobacter]KAA6224646.1 ferritin [Campylobacter sp. LR185c]KAA6225646.1 ferritin [Campylobacter sp. LR286c]KAA6225765.1 ferritin [Campylobacter sp. LR196d]KAA6229619.1 ferritin [Campylobacter sp. LR291e]KAA6230136.1 ferritin [Campylobacter sp. LR264d]